MTKVRHSCRSPLIVSYDLDSLSYTVSQSYVRLQCPQHVHKFFLHPSVGEYWIALCVGLFPRCLLSRQKSPLVVCCAFQLASAGVRWKIEPDSSRTLERSRLQWTNLASSMGGSCLDILVLPRMNTGPTMSSCLGNYTSVASLRVCEKRRSCVVAFFVVNEKSQIKWGASRTFSHCETSRFLDWRVKVVVLYGASFSLSAC